MNAMNKAEYDKVCGNIGEMDEEEFSRLFNLIVYERMRRDYDTFINSPRNFSGYMKFRCLGGHGQMAIALMEFGHDQYGY